MNEPLVSICIPCYNHGQYLKAAIDSALSQTYQNIEVLVSDNASDDMTSNVMSGYKTHPKVRSLYQPKTIPMTNHWNTFKEVAMGEWVVMLCSDDILHSDAIAECISAIGEGCDVTSVFFEYDYLASEGVVRKTPFYDGSYRIPASQQFLIFLKGNNFPLTGAMVRKDVLDRLGWFNTEYSFCSDWFMWLNVTANSVGQYVAYVNNKLFLYRQHSGAETLKCITRRNTISEIERMKEYFLENFCHQDVVDEYRRHARAGTKRLAKRYSDMAKESGDLQLALYYDELCGSYTDNSAIPIQSIKGPPYPPPVGSLQSNRCGEEIASNEHGAENLRGRQYTKAEV